MEWDLLLIKKEKACETARRRTSSDKTVENSPETVKSCRSLNYKHFSLASFSARARLLLIRVSAIV